MEDEIQNECMEIGHDDETADTGNDAPELNFVVTLNTAREIVCDLAMKFYHEEPSDSDGDTAKEPAPVECPLHD